MIIVLFVSLSYFSYAQSGRSFQKAGTGFAMTMSGIGLTVGGFTTRPDKYYVGNGVWQVKPFHKQGGRSSVIICGISLTITGLITSIVNSPKRR